MNMSISSNEKYLTKERWAEVIYNLYNTVINKLPPRTVKSIDGKYSYTFKSIRLPIEGIDFNDEICKKYGVEKRESQFALGYHRINLHIAGNGKISWKPDELMNKMTVTDTIAEILWYYTDEFPFVTNENMFRNIDIRENNIAFLIINGIFDGVSERNINKWLKDNNITEEDTIVIVENAVKFLKKKVGEILN